MLGYATISASHLLDSLASKFNLFYKSALLKAAKEGDLATIERCVKKVGIDAQESDYGALAEDSTALIIAARYGHAPIVDFLIKESTAVNAHNNDHCTALIYAACWGHKEIVKRLIDANATPDKSRAICGTTPLMFAAAHGHAKIVDLLLKAGADAYAKNHKGQTALDLINERKKLGYEPSYPGSWDKIIASLKHAQENSVLHSKNNKNNKKTKQIFEMTIN